MEAAALVILAEDVEMLPRAMLNWGAESDLAPRGSFFLFPVKRCAGTRSNCVRCCNVFLFTDTLLDRCDVGGRQ